MPSLEARVGHVLEEHHYAEHIAVVRTMAALRLPAGLKLLRRLVPPPTRPLASQYDYVIVGAGSAGCVLANELTQDASASVLLIEAGTLYQCLPYAIDAEITRRRPRRRLGHEPLNSHPRRRLQRF